MSAEVLTAETNAIPRVIAQGADQPYWDGLLEGRVRLQACAGCGRWHWPAVWRCGDCGSWEHDWRDVEPVGEIFTWTRSWHPFGGLEAVDKPFVSLVVSVDGTDGRRLTGILEGDETGVAIGARVRGRIDAVTVMGRRIPAIRWSVEASR